MNGSHGSKKGAALASMPSVELRLNSARNWIARGQLTQAELILRDCIGPGPVQADALNLLSGVTNATGRAAEALEFAEHALRVSGKPEFEFSRGRALKSLGRIPEAILAYRKALQIRDHYPEVWVSLGMAYRLIGQFDSAIESYRRALAQRPDFLEAMMNLGNALAERFQQYSQVTVTSDDLTEAQNLQRRALELAPGNPFVLHNLAVTLSLAGRYDEAGGLFNAALGADPHRVDSCVCWSDLLVKTGRPAEAIGICKKWIEGNGGNADVLFSLGCAQVRTDAIEEGIVVLRQALALRPNWPEAEKALELALADALPPTFDARSALESFRRTLDARPELLDIRCSYLMTSCYVEEDAVRLADEHRALRSYLGAPARAQARRNTPPKRLRVGIMSYDFKRHSVAYFIENLFIHHDSSRIELMGYQTNEVEDDMTQRLCGLCEGWARCGSLPDGQLVERMKADQLDVLVDLAGLTKGHRIGVLQMRPAPVQLTYLGYPATTGIPAIDFRISDAWIDPLGSEHLSTEAILRMRRGMFCFKPDSAAVPDVSPPPLERNGYVTFGSFNNLAKISVSTLQLWSSLLRSTRGSHLALKSRGTGERANRAFLLRYFQEQGIAPERIEFVSWQANFGAHLEHYAGIDIALDTFPYNGATTTCEALWMGVPVVSLCGATQPSRMGRSILSAAGFPEWVADDTEHFLEIAKALANDPESLGPRRHEQRSRLESSPLLDAGGFAEDFTDLLSEAVQSVRS